MLFDRHSLYYESNNTSKYFKPLKTHRLSIPKTKLFSRSQYLASANLLSETAGLALEPRIRWIDLRAPINLPTRRSFYPPPPAYSTELDMVSPLNKAWRRVSR